jgi:hypothetical protein
MGDEAIVIVLVGAGLFVAARLIRLLPRRGGARVSPARASAASAARELPGAGSGRNRMQSDG